MIQEILMEKYFTINIHFETNERLQVAIWKYDRETISEMITKEPVSYKLQLEGSRKVTDRY